MPTTNEAVDYLKTKVDIYIPAKAANAGGVATSALEMAQNSARLFWSSEEVSLTVYCQLFTVQCLFFSVTSAQCHIFQTYNLFDCKK